MPADRTPITGRFHIEATPSLVTADVASLVENNVDDVLNLLMDDEFFETFMELACAEPTAGHDGHAPERLTFEELKAKLVERLATKVALTGPQALRAARRMEMFAKPMVAAAEQAEAALLHFAKQERRAS
ncbi:hypothetical protein ACGF1Z_31420 [Streptomyces sp. NPDC048018]|uniref:hypothetical protein n=1 Tax=Streptomyces sp. NPDC048018 TaxID=3365499 RepID=UPI003710D5A9